MAKTGAAVIRTASTPPPTGGLNARDALADMPPEDAPVLVNWFPTPSSMVLRGGYSNFATGFPGWVETVMHYSGYSANKMFGISGGSVYNITAGGAVPAADLSGLTNSRWQHVNFGTPGNQYLIMVNGADAPRAYDGTVWTAPVITVATPANFIHVNVFKNRLWFTEKNTMKIWYLPVDSIAGAAASIDFGSLFRLGGYLMAMTNWTINTGAGINDFAAFISSEGEVALYNGTDPSSATTWALVGIFRIGKPIGRRCFQKVGADVVFVCADGAFPMSKALVTDRSELNASLSDKIQPLLTADAKAYNSNFGWQPMLYPIGNKLLINVPQTENSVQYQYVMNTVNGSWTKFTGWNAACWEFFNDGLYFGGNTVVGLADSGTNDNGASITTDGKCAFTYFGARGRIKRITMARPTFTADAPFSPSVALNMDYADSVPQAASNFISTVNSGWDTSPWDTTPWAGATQVLKNWQTVTGVGTAASLRVKTSTMGISINWQANDFAYELGGVL